MGQLPTKGLPVSAPSPTISSENSKIKLSVSKGLRVGKSYALKEGVTYLGRKGPHAVDVDLTEQENPGVAVAVNRFALIWFDKNGLGIADTGRRVSAHQWRAHPGRQANTPSRRGHVTIRQDGVASEGHCQEADRGPKMTAG